MDWNSLAKSIEFKGKTILSVDYGTKRVGLASFCPGRDPYPTPLFQFSNAGDDTVIQQILEVVANDCIEVVIVGLPHLTDGTATDMTKKIQNWGGRLKNQLNNCSFFFQDETLSSFEAEERMKKDPRYNFKIDAKHLDALAASIILEDFLKN